MMKTDEKADNSGQKQEFYAGLRKFLEETYPDQPAGALLDHPLHGVDKYEELFLYLDGIYEYRERYNLHWALHETQDRMNALVEESRKNVRDFLADHFRDDEMGEFSALTAKMAAIAREKSMKVHRISGYFNTISFLVSMVDIVISVILIIIISEIAQFGHTLIDSVILGILLLGFIAFFKVTLDRFFIIPRVTAWGWQRYLREVRVAKQMLVETRAISYIVIESIGRKDDPQVTCSLFGKGIYEMSQI